MAHIDRKRLLLSAIVAGAFSSMLVGTSRPKDEASPAADAKPEAKADAKTDAKTDAKADAPRAQASAPSDAGWKVVQLDAAGVQLKVPPGASVDPAGSGNDASFAGRYFRVKMPSGFEVAFAQNSGSPVDFVEQKRWYEHDASGFVGLVLEAPDALVAHRKEADPIGEYWEASTCSPPIDGKPICTQAAGALVDIDNKVTKMTNEEVLAVVTIARSIAAK